MDISKLLLEDIKIGKLLDVTKTRAAFLFENITYPWEALDHIGEAILKIGAALPEEEFDHPKEDVWIAKDAKVYPTAWITGPCIIDHGSEVRHCAFIRGNALVGQNCVVGNSVELKNVILFDNVQTPHYNYVGDSILGYKAHMGAGSITSNVKSDRSPVAVKSGEVQIDSGRKKFGAILGDQVEIGCNTVLNPGTVVGKASTVYPVSCVRGFVPAHTIYKAAEDIVFKVKTPPVI